MLDLGDHPPWPVPGSLLIREAAIADQRGVARSAAGAAEDRLPGSSYPEGLTSPTAFSARARLRRSRASALT
jgi:hypothetical protein